NVFTSLNSSGASNIYFNFAGGTLRVTNTTTAFLPATVSGATLAATIFGPVNNSAVNGAPSFNGGVTGRTNRFNMTIPPPPPAPPRSGARRSPAPPANPRPT